MSSDPRTYSQNVPVQTTTTLDDVPPGDQLAIFVALTGAMATGHSPEVARLAIAKRYVVPIIKVEEVEREGRRRGWATA